ncbi:MAG TPA: GtrA family protein [Puia sp.]|jgi:putative flippase GtrA
MAGIVTFTKAQAASLIASAVDFSVSWLLFNRLAVPYIAGGVTGTLCGGVTHFLISRNWAFSAQEKKWTGQLSRYIPVWIGNLVLNASGLWFLKSIVGWPFWPAKIVTAIGIAVFYNYVLQKRFVFK